MSEVTALITDITLSGNRLGQDLTMSMSLCNVTDTVTVAAIVALQYLHNRGYRCIGLMNINIF